MPVAKRAQKRKRETEPTKIQDLPLELLETIARHLDVKDVRELMMVNKRLYSIYTMDQSIVFGKHVAVVFLGRRSEPKNWIRKFVNSPPFQPNATLLPFVKRIDSCGMLYVSFYDEPSDVWLLKQLKSVNQLDFYVQRKEDCLTFLNNFGGSVKKKARLNIRIGSFEQDQAIKELLGKFIENQLNECEKIILYCHHKDCFHVYHEAMMKTQIKMITIKTSRLEFDKVVERIVNQGVPSKNSEAVVRIVMQTDKYELRDSRINRFISQAQGLLRVDDGENHSALVSHANQLLRENDEDAYDYAYETKTSCFRRRFDATMSCIYVLYTFVSAHRFGIEPEDPSDFLAFYVPSL